MKKLPLLVCLLLAAALVVVWSMDQRTKAQLQQQTEALRQANATLDDLRAENDRIKNQIAQTGSASGEQISELLKLRAEVTRLRQSATELKTLRAQNEQLRQTAASAPRPDRTTNAPPDVPPQDIHPRETWTYAGYATPDATVQSMLWGATQTNREAFLAGFAPEMRAQIEANFAQDSNGFSEKMGKTTGFRVIDRKMISAEEMDVTVYLEGEGMTDTSHFKQINGEWKITK